MALALVTSAVATGTLIASANLVGASGSTAPPKTWSTARQIPGLAALNVGGSSDASAISCPTPGNCAVAGLYATSSGSNGTDEGFIDDEKNGIWGSAQEIPGLGTLNIGEAVRVWSISCKAAGECAAGGSYDTSGNPYVPGGQGFVVDETAGKWGNAQEVPGLAALNMGTDAWVRSISCGGVGDCSAVGIYTDAQGHSQGFVVDESAGTWGTAEEVPGLATLNSGGSAYVETVSCPAAGDCSAVGNYKDALGHTQSFSVNKVGGIWGSAEEIPALGALDSGGSALVGPLSCAASGDCAAGGAFTDAHGHWQGFTVDETGGTWHNAQGVAGLVALNVGKSAYVSSVSCAVVGTCVAGGTYLLQASPYHSRGFVVAESKGQWGRAHEIPGLDVLDVLRASEVTAVSCGAAGSCTAVGSYANGKYQRGFVVSESNGTWGRADGIPGLLAFEMRSVSCTSADYCAAVGEYARTAGRDDSFVLSRPGTPPHCSEATGLRATVTSHQRSKESVAYRIVFTNGGQFECELIGIPGALGFSAVGHRAIGPPAQRTEMAGRGGTTYLEPVVGRAEATFVVRTSILKAMACQPLTIDEVIVRPMGSTQLVVPLKNSSTLERTICRGLRNEAVYGFGPVDQPLT
jgi:hypothetical protein